MKKKGILKPYTIIIFSSLIYIASCKKEGEVQLINFNRSVSYSTMKDQDDNTYKTVKIGTQTWMAENLRTTKYRNGDSIPNISNHNQWVSLTTGAYCNYRNDENKVNTYGRLYNWYAVNDSNNLAPAGWHVATDDEWAELIYYLGGDSLASAKLKEAGDYHWFEFYEVSNATNESGFTALPGGFRQDILFSETFTSISLATRWWSSTENNSTTSWSREIFSENNRIKRNSYKKTNGYSVRCVKD